MQSTNILMKIKHLDLQVVTLDVKKLSTELTELVFWTFFGVNSPIISEYSSQPCADND